MAEAVSVKVKGLRELNSALKRYDRDLKVRLETRLKEAADLVATDARGRFSAIDARSAAGFRPRIRGFGRVVVEQRLRKKTGEHPEYGTLQMRRALIPALSSERERVFREIEDMLDTLGKETGF